MSFKNLILAGALVALSSSCLEEYDGLSYSGSSYYLLDTEGGYIPQMRFNSYEIENPVLTLEGKDIEFYEISDGFFEIKSSYDNSFSNVKDGEGSVLLTGLDGKTETIPLDFKPTTKKIGDAEIDIKFNDDEQVLNIVLKDTVVNAEKYYLMLQEQILGSEGQVIDRTMWMPYRELSLNIKDLDEEINLDGLYDGVTYNLNIAASNGSALKLLHVSGISATIDKD